jgi:hypothetical protein
MHRHAQKPAQAVVPEMRDADDREHTGSSTASRLSSACAAALKRRVEPRSKASVGSQPESRYSFADGKKVVDHIDRAQYRMQSRAMHCKVMDWAMTAKGDRDAFGFDWCSDYCRHRRHLFLGDRQVCQGSPAGAATQASRDPDLSRGNPATDSASSRRLYLGAFRSRCLGLRAGNDALRCRRGDGMEPTASVAVQKFASLPPRVRHADFRTKATLDQ